MATRGEFNREYYGRQMGVGDYYMPRNGSGTDASQEVARANFLLAIQQRHPGVLHSLEKDVLSPFDRLMKKRQATGHEPFLGWPQPAFLRLDLIDPCMQDATQITVSDEYSKWARSPEVIDMIENGTLRFEKFGSFWEELQPEWGDLQAALLGWAIRWNLLQDWILDEALQSLHFAWHDSLQPEDGRLDRGFNYWWGSSTPVQGDPMHSEVAEYHFEGGQGTGTVIDLEAHPGFTRSFEPGVKRGRKHPEWVNLEETRRRFKFLHDGWNPVFERWEDVEPMLRDAFEWSLRDFRDQTRADIEAKGFVPAPQKATFDHFEILADRIVGRSTIDELAGRFGCSRTAIMNAIKRTSDLLGIDPPRFKAGRPSKEQRKSQVRK